MSVEYLKKRKDVAWVDESNFKKGEFGPPVFDETSWAYRWRVFKRGFLWGNIDMNDNI